MKKAPKHAQTKKQAKKVTKKTTTKKVTPKKSTPKTVAPKKNKKKHRKIRYMRVFTALGAFALLIIASFSFLDLPIRNIEIYGNTMYSDQQIMEMSNLNSYPSFYKTFASSIEHKLEKDVYIKEVKVTKSFGRRIKIEITENYPLFFNQHLNKTVLKDGQAINDKFILPTLVNYVPDTIYEKFIKKISLLNQDVIDRISEMKYDPKDVDQERFLFTMNDGNYVYVTLYSLENINNYVDMVKGFQGKKGILNLDYGDFFTVLG